MDVEKPNLVIVADFSYIDGGAHKVAIQTAQVMSSIFNVIYFSQQNKEDGSFDPHLISDNITVISPGTRCKNDSLTPFRAMMHAVYNKKAQKEFSQVLDSLSPRNTVVHIHTWGRILSSSVIKEATKRNFPVLITLHDYLTVCPNGNLFNFRTCKICTKRPMSLSCICCNCIDESYMVKLGKVIRNGVQYNVLRSAKKLYFGFISEASKKILQANGKLFSSSNCFLIPNPNDLADMEKEERVKCEKNTDFLYIGNLSKLKGIDLFCEAIHQLDLKGVVIGSGPRLTELREKYPNIEFTGWLNAEEIATYFQRTRALVFPSLWYEGRALVPAEAMLYGIPLIISDKTTVYDYVLHNINGVLFETGNLISLKNILYQFSVDDNMVQKFSEGAYKHRNQFVNSIAQYSTELEKIYNKMLSD